MVLCTMCILFLGCGQKDVGGRDLKKFEKRDVVSRSSVVGRGVLPVVSPGKKDPATDLEGADGAAGANGPVYLNAIDLETDILKDLKAKTFTDREGVIDHFFRLRESFFVLKGFEYYHSLNYSATDGEDGSKFPPLVPEDVLSESDSSFSLGIYKSMHIYLSSWKRGENYLYAFLYGMNQIEKSVKKIEGDAGVYLDGINSFLQKVSSMTSLLSATLDFSSGKDSALFEKKFRENVEMERLQNFNVVFEKYLRKLQSVSDCIFGNVLRVLKKIDTKKDSSQDFYSLLNRMNNDTKIIEAIDIVKRDKDFLLNEFDSLLVKFVL